MASVTRCLEGIEKVRRVAMGAEMAYVARSRLARLILDVSRLAAARARVPLPDKPSKLQLPEGADAPIVVLQNSCSRLIDISKTITQPSEPLDERWTAGWAALLVQLDEVEKHLRHMA